MKAVIYARYSSERQTEQSIEGQLRECNEFAEQNDITVIGNYIDRAKTGRNDNRAEFQRMLCDSKRGMFDAVIVWKIDRFGRNREDIAKNKAILRLNGVRVLYAREHIPDSAEGIILEGLLESLAEYYSVELREKIVRGMRESAYKCQFNGSGLATGYSVDKDHKYHVDPDGAQIVRMIFNMYDQGSSIAEIRRTLISKGIKTVKGNEYTHQGVKRILSNRQYIGEYRWGDIIVPDGVPRIIDDDLFERVQKAMEKKRKTLSRAKNDEVSFLLTTKLFCGHCKSTMVGDSGTSKSGNTFYYYTCRSKKARKTCNKKSVRKEWIEREVVELTVKTVLQDDIIEYIADRVVAIQEQERKESSALDYLNHRLADTNASIKNIMKAIEAGIITESTGERLRELESERKELLTNIERESLERPLVDRNQVIYFLNRFKGGDIDDIEYCQQIIDLFVDKIYLYDDKITITYNHSGESNEITADIIEDAADKAHSDALSGCSDTLPSGPPKQANPNLMPIGNGFGFLISDKLFCQLLTSS